MTMLEIRSRQGSYPVAEFPELRSALQACAEPGTFTLIDRRVQELYAAEVADALVPERTFAIEASEDAKSFDALAPVFTWLVESGLKRNGHLVVVGGGVLQDIGCFVASVLFRGVRWSLVPTTLLAQADSCIGSKSSINLGRFKNQIGTFYAPHRVALAPAVLRTLTHDDVRSGVGEMVKLHLLAGEEGYRALAAALAAMSGDVAELAPWVASSLRIKQRYIEEDELDTGVRNLLNYGHTFAHAFESVTHYAIPHGIAVTLGVLNATLLSARRGMVPDGYFERLRRELHPWYAPYDRHLRGMDAGELAAAIRLDKKNTVQGVNCILTEGAGAMRKVAVGLEEELLPAVAEFAERAGQPVPAPQGP